MTKSKRRLCVRNDVAPWIYALMLVYTTGMAKHLVDLDDDALSAARAELGTTTIKDNVNEALRRATAERAERIRNALDVLANAPLDDREDAWR
jgi:Arc/MetJ family transcription regulator